MSQVQAFNARQVFVPGKLGTAAQKPRAQFESFQRQHIGDLQGVQQQTFLKALSNNQSKVNTRYFDPAQNSQDVKDYYKDVMSQFSTLDPKSLYSALHDLVTKTHTHPLNYDPAQNLYPWVDVHPQGDLESIYSQTKADPQEAILADLERQSKLPPADQSVDDYQPGVAVGHDNCEHVVPQSWFHKQLPERGDLHHLFACDVNSNSQRGNAKYADLPGDSHGQVLVDPATNRARPAAGLGAVARATLYFLLRYPGDIGDSPGEYNGRDLATLLKWNHDYPPTEYEHHRNEEIQKKQGNRNPLIDFPDLAAKIDFQQGLAPQARIAA